MALCNEVGLCISNARVNSKRYSRTAPTTKLMSSGKTAIDCSANLVLINRETADLIAYSFESPCPSGELRFIAHNSALAAASKTALTRKDRILHLG